MNREELARLIDNKVNEIFYDYQTSEGISSGDISPDYMFELDELQEKLTDLVIKSMEWNKPLYKQEFPDFDCELKIPEGFTDCSYHNDIMPHVERRVKFGTIELNIMIWQDYEDEQRREYEDESKYIFVIKEPNIDLIIFEYRSNLWGEIENLIKNTCMNYWNWEDIKI